MPRLFYIALGAAAGIVAVRRAAAAAAALSPNSVAGSLVAAVKEFADDVREGMAVRENELRAVFTLEPGEGGDGDGDGEVGTAVAMPGPRRA
jgi:hypothetical protein